MLFQSNNISLANLNSLCRALRHQLEAGISPVRIFQQQSKRGPREMRQLYGRVHVRVKNGESITSSLKKEKGFPNLFLALLSVGEQTGHLPEILAALEQYYTLQMQLKRKFLAQITLPVIQFFMAVFIVAFVIWFLGMIATPGVQMPKPLGLSGTPGALTFLGIVFGTIIGLFVFYKVLSISLQNKASVDRVLLRIPGLGPCLEAIALSRFTLALQLTLDTGMAIHKALKLSLQATGNAAYECLVDSVARVLKSGDTLTIALSGTRVFPKNFIEVLAVSEESGRVPEVMRKQCDFYNEEAEIRLKVLAKLLGWGLWLIYAVFAIIMIFALAQEYFKLLPK